MPHYLFPPSTNLPRTFVRPPPPTSRPFFNPTPSPPSLPNTPLFPCFSLYKQNMKLISVLSKKSSSYLPFSKSKSKSKSESKSLMEKLSKGEPLSFGSSTSSSSLESSNTAAQSTPKSVLSLSVADVFNVFDRDRDGKITKVELEAVLSRLGPDPLTEEEVRSMVMEADRDGDGCISLEEMELIDIFNGGVEGDYELEEMRRVFRVFDLDGDGKISAEELKGVFEVLGEGDDCGIEDCRRMIQGVDSDGDGFVSFHDFLRMMTVAGGEER